MVAHALMEAGVNDAPWRDEHQLAERKTRKMFAVLEQIATALESQGIRAAVIENGGVAYALSRCWGCFASSDLDLLIRREDFVSVEREFIRQGYAACTRGRSLSDSPDDAQFGRRGWKAYRREEPDGVEHWVNLMWRPVVQGWLPIACQLQASELLARSIHVTEHGSDLRVLSPEDQLLVCAAHTASHSYVRGIGLRLQVDVDRIVRRMEIDWEVFLRRARESVGWTVIFPSLAIPKGLWDTPVPVEVLDALVPSRRKQARILESVGRAGLFQRNKPVFGRLKYLLFHAGLCERGLTAGLIAALFPPRAWMREVYGDSSSGTLVSYGRRLASLLRRPRP